MAASNVPKGRVESALFYGKLEELKESRRQSQAKPHCLLKIVFFDETTTWLQTNPE